jgi:hypothetical protein
VTAGQFLGRALMDGRQAPCARSPTPTASSGFASAATWNGAKVIGRGAALMYAPPTSRASTVTRPPS